MKRKSSSRKSKRSLGAWTAKDRKNHTRAWNWAKPKSKSKSKKGRGKSSVGEIRTSKKGNRWRRTAKGWVRA